MVSLAVYRTLVQFTGTACTKAQMTALGQTAYTLLFVVCFKAVAGRTAVWRHGVWTGKVTGRREVRFKRNNAARIYLEGTMNNGLSQDRC